MVTGYLHLEVMQGRRTKALSQVDSGIASSNVVSRLPCSERSN